MLCPLCSNAKTALQTRLEVAEIVSLWQKVHGIDVRGEFDQLSVLELYKCFECGLSFFKPDSAAGSAALYEALEKQDDYYLPEKWEHDAALQDIGGSRDGLEIGCGFGAFVARVIAEKKIAFEGCEQNQSAVKVGQSRGIPVRLEKLEEVARRRPASYDAICAFQVLEHVSNPGEFLKDACNLLRPGGKLILGLPNSKSSISRFVGLFDAPPHHMTRWNDEVLENLPRLFALELVRVAYEPLPDTKVEMYFEAFEDSLRRRGLGRLVHPWFRTRAIRLLRKSMIRRFLRGDTIYGCYLRKESGVSCNQV